MGATADEHVEGDGSAEGGGGAEGDGEGGHGDGGSGADSGGDASDEGDDTVGTSDADGPRTAGGSGGSSRAESRGDDRGRAGLRGKHEDDVYFPPDVCPNEGCGCAGHIRGDRDITMCHQVQSRDTLKVPGVRMVDHGGFRMNATPPGSPARQPPVESTSLFPSG
eukprot:gene17433-15877_t